MRIIEEEKLEDYVREKVIEHNMRMLPDELKTPNEDISFLLKEDDDTIVGGITANMFWHHMHIEFFWVEETLRGKGYGSALLEKMETAAREKGCRFIHLDTFSFQAPDFYKRHGFEVFGTLEDHPEGFAQYYMVKRFDR
ncbi:GNAT family N-acetyltransferase [Halobacillus sp. ACCC02827]|uniref:GNAT family N-acetyltransferase n=1 Tax=Bacillaceae TaxID=186817 RepID=UPI0002A522EC|nr:MULTISPECIES: GNAT family N-acetyltransferase [Bacillaceae]ELK45986.1 integral membrane protein [Halobacillus sp. BAB-2008]QHT46213.1 GNAT family N-acetyltransferase [Bacillus sp. SB49]WJE17030.1 GNAT family N-acetyltransferase [Halobacillus sp. ACCC02827]